MNAFYITMAIGWFFLALSWFWPTKKWGGYTIRIALSALSVGFFVATCIHSFFN